MATIFIFINEVIAQIIQNNGDLAIWSYLGKIPYAPYADNDLSVGNSPLWSANAAQIDIKQYARKLPLKLTNMPRISTGSLTRNGCLDDFFL